MRVSQRGWPCRQEGLVAPFCSPPWAWWPMLARALCLQLAPYPRTYCSSVLSLAKGQPRSSVAPGFGGEKGGEGSGGRGEALGWRAVSSALAARKYWSLGLPVALQYCIAALVRLEIGPCRRSWGSGSWGAASAPPRSLPRCRSGALVSHTNKPLRRQQRTRAWCR